MAPQFTAYCPFRAEKALISVSGALSAAKVGLGAFSRDEDVRSQELVGKIARGGFICLRLNNKNNFCSYSSNIAQCVHL